MKKYTLIDIFKLVFAIGIVAIHAKIFDSNKTINWLALHGIFRLGVPFFFVASGYFFYKKLERNGNFKLVLNKYIKRLLIPYIFWLVLNLPFVVYKYYSGGNSILKIIIKLIRDLIFYPWGAMWYLLALMVAVIIIVPFYKKNKLKNIVIIGSILYLFALICNTYYFLVEGTFFQSIIDNILKVIESSRNGIFEGLYFVSVGMYISKLSDDKKISYKKNNIIFIISYLLLIIEILLTKNYVHRDDHSLFIMFIVLIPSLFIFLSQFNLNLNTIKFRNYSTGIYFSHRFVLAGTELILGMLNITISNLLLFIIVLSIVLIMLTIVYKINNKYINYVVK